jgi:hypothetical protein
MSAPLFSVVTVRDGLIVRTDEFSGRADALEAAGLKEEAMSLWRGLIDRKLGD